MQPPLPLQIGHFDGVGGGEKKRGPGRPKGSGNKRQPDLARYLAAMGGTPGQQMAQLAMCTPAEVKRARKDAEQLGLRVEGLSALEVAEVVKADRLAKALGVTRAEAYAARHKARVELLPYVHQKQPAAKDPSDRAPAAVAYLVPEGDAREASALLAFDDDEALEIAEDLLEPGAPVGNGQSDDA